MEQIRTLLMQAIKGKTKSPLWDAKQIMKTMTDNEKKLLFADSEIQEMTAILDRNILPSIDETYVPFGPPVENPYE